MPQVGGEHGKNNEFHELGPLSQFSCYEVGSLIRSDTVWNTVMVDKAFCKLTDGRFGRSTVRREDKSISGMSIPVRTKYHPSMVEVIQYSQPATS